MHVFKTKLISKTECIKPKYYSKIKFVKKTKQ